jgi:hypothetical protein
MHRLRDWSHRATVVLLVTSVVLIGPALAGAGSSPLLVGALLLAAGGLTPARERLRELPSAAGYDLDRYGQDLWLGPLLGAGMALYWLGASPEELQALGGVAGLIGMANYFLRPLYLFVLYHLWRLLGVEDRARSSEGPSQ